MGMAETLPWHGGSSGFESAGVRLPGKSRATRVPCSSPPAGRHSRPYDLLAAFAAGWACGILIVLELVGSIVNGPPSICTRT